MPRAARMVRTRALLAVRTAMWLTGLAIVSGSAAAVRSAGDDWWIALLVWVAAVAGLTALLTVIDRRTVRPALDRARRRDRADLTADERSLPYGVVAGPDGSLLLPTKTSIVVMVAIVLVITLGLALVLLLGSDDPVEHGLGWVFLAVSVLVAALGACLPGTRYRLTTEGIESSMRLLPTSRTWIEVPEIRIDRQVVVLKAAGARTPRVWVRVGALEVSMDDCLAMIRRQRGW